MVYVHSKYFKIDEFCGVEPHPDLIQILEEMRVHVGKPISITSGPRSIEDHIEVYKGIYGDDWINKIPWGSRHLPKHGTQFLRAVDIKCGSYAGQYLADLAEKVSHVPIGIGVGKSFIHIDVDRDCDVRWVYNY